MKQTILKLQPEKRVNYQLNSNYDAGNKKIYIIEVLTCNPWGDVIVVAVGNNGTQAAFKNCAPFTKRDTSIDGATIDDNESWDFIILM